MGEGASGDTPWPIGPRLSHKARDQRMGECQPLDNSLSHVPDVGERRIVQTAPGIEKGPGSPKDPGPRMFINGAG
jgi:hypothetical protein